MSKKQERHWYELKVGDAWVAREVFSAAAEIQREQAGKRARTLRYLSRIENTPIANVYADPDRLSWASSSAKQLVPSSNMMRRVMSTVITKLGSSTPLITVQTAGARLKGRKRGKLLARAVDGLFASCSVPDVSRKVLGDAMSTGDGYALVTDDGEKPVVEFVPSDEVLVSFDDGLYGDPLVMMRVKYALRSKLAAKFPEHAAKIETAKAGLSEAYAPHDTDRVAVVEAWRRADPNGENGRHVIAMADLVLLDDEWTKEYHPLVRLGWEPRRIGYASTSLGHLLYPTQCRLDRINTLIVECAERMAYPRVIYDVASDTPTEALGGKVGGLIPYDSTRGQPPVFVTPAGVPPELLQERDFLIREMLAEGAVSTWDARAELPPGIKSGVALETVADQNALRFVEFGKRYGRWHVELAQRLLDVCKDLYASKKKLAITVPGRRFLSTIDWAEADLGEIPFELRLFDVGALGATPTGRAQKLREMYDGGEISRDTYLRAIETFDAETATNLATAASEAVEAILDAIVDDGEAGYRSPTVYMDLAEALKQAHARYLLEDRMGTEPETLALIAQFLDECQQLMDAATPPPPAPEQAQQAPQPAPQA